MTQEGACQEMEDLLVLMLDDELSPEEKQRVERHVATCRTCAVALEEHRRLVGVLGELPEAPPGSIRDRAIAAHRQAAGRETAWRWLGAAATVLLTLTLSWFGYHLYRTHVEGEPIPDLPVVEEIVSLYDVGAEDLVQDLELVRAVFELSQEALPEGY
jgi:ferric-dicitrate binding protein FerR (iron transport regulator)